MSDRGSSSLAALSTWELRETVVDSLGPPASDANIERYDRGDKKCFNCDSEQHMSWNCTEPMKLKEGQACFNCGSNGVFFFVRQF
ncbi:hypothetical protein NEOLI_001661 [Neolecta irregularis DAH-3]|uniref:CCHC-type domain-containing protein n=1 Tax=Neolecta irregularis (strain DAH-3) TaxID=1198029 RepID=A0A1U7LLX8_NEOID|nr:hypothetical protein NEOLI_001661 [Neolecta irregularis DAH-3]|eukprot:OLL23649.1 hypothetical protein NEOLI_001661 [Neolecta irregularis DAH-3]